MGNDRPLTETWEYWEEKFKGMTEKEIKEYWDREFSEAEDDSIGYAMDAADGLEIGTRSSWARQDYENYKRLKEIHDKEKADREEGEER